MIAYCAVVLGYHLAARGDLAPTPEAAREMCGRLFRGARPRGRVAKVA